MVLYLLRHEVRRADNLYFNANLTSIGKYNSNVKLFNKLNNLQIDELYSSPYKRTLETVNMFSITKKIPIKIDWALSEYLSDNDKINYSKKEYPNKETQLSIHKNYYLDTEYIPTTELEYITTYNEKEIDFHKRIDNFILFLSTKMDENILVVTHGNVCSRITKKIMGDAKHFKMGECLKLDFCNI